MMKRICVFCGSNHGASPEYARAAARLAETIAEQGIGLVYGGASVGLMKVIADTALRHGGEVIGVIPHRLVDRELAHRGLSRLYEVESMHERKAQMADLADGFITLPGGLGTMEEFTEVMSWRYLGIHRKPCGLLNVGGYYDSLLQFLDGAVAQGFIKGRDRDAILVESEPTRMVARIVENFCAPTDQWPERREQT
jgi:uncharacterized protein (TIGR00730 family)